MNRISAEVFCVIGQLHPDVCQSNTVTSDMPYFKMDGSLHVKKNEGGYFEDWDATEEQLMIIGDKWYSVSTDNYVIKRVA